MSNQMFFLLTEATWQTLEMVFVASLFTVVLGLPLGVLLLITRENHLFEGVTIHRSIAMVVNAVRSIPFIILMVAIAPITQILMGTTIGTLAAMVPLTISAIPFFARIVESAMLEVPFGLIEASTSMGASPLQIISKVLIPESLPGIVRGITLMLITLVGYSAMAGTIGGGGLGDVAIRYGYQRFEINIMIITILVLIALVQIFQYGGDWVANRLAHNK